MRRSSAIAAVMDAVDDELVVACNGMIGRETFASCDRPENFYMIGSMGLALSIGLGVALSKPDRRCLVLDGDGNVLMGAGVLATVAATGAENLLHVVFDNESHASTGGQRTVSDAVPLEALALACGYRSAVRVTAEEFAGAVPGFLASRGPAMLLVKVEPGNEKGVPRVSHTPQEITQRFSGRAQA